jgi:hypothetical protein
VADPPLFPDNLKFLNYSKILNDINAEILHGTLSGFLHQLP